MVQVVLRSPLFATLPFALHYLMANTIFTLHESQNKARLSQVFLLWCILNDESFDMGAFIFYQLVFPASYPKSPIACGRIISSITYAWGLEPLIRKLTPLFHGGRLDLAACINTKGWACLCQPPWPTSFSTPKPL